MFTILKFFATNVFDSLTTASQMDKQSSSGTTRG